MKTPRELLLDHHRKVESRLDAIRRTALATVKSTEPQSAPMSLRDFLRSLRWHFASISAIWLFILFLHLDTGRSSSMMASVPPIMPASPRIIMASLRENRRQLNEMIEPLSSDSEPRKQYPLKPRSDRRTETVIA
jgi:hypothetical protein